MTVWEAPTQESEINSIAQEIGKLIKKKTPLSSIYIFSGDLERQKSDFKVIFNREHIPYSFWNDVRDTVECGSIFPFEPNTVVFGEMGAVFISGASYVAKDAFLMTEDERSYFNEKLGKNVFKTQAETKEETKELLSFLISHSKKLYVSYTHHLTVSFKEFLEEHKNYSFKKLAFQSELAERVPQVILKSLKPLSLLVLKQKKEEILPQSYSVRALTQYERCPYGFLLKECLHLEPEKKITSELSYAEEGELVHTILFRYFTKPSSLEKCCEEAYAVISDKFKKEILYPDRLRIEKGLSHFLKAEKEWQTKSRFTPTFFERPFDKFPLSWKGKTIYLRGKIDRIDIDEKTKEFKVIDYKTGSHIPKSFQLQLYAMAMETLFLKGYHVAEGVFYMLKNSEMKKGFECPTLSEWQLEKEKTVEKIFELVHQIESFSFPATPHTCYDSCETKNVCEHTENI
ncbi:MAG: hypothetical protein A3A72_08585 [Deltaproteobacteria bacterium RIFCSPLOWO2_01_FULL_38_9]|nr:MAG: hypothetical protein A3A72_08585 [Deltaproteobacteria bacterium RIFCSPLOWO2_01_FULL_38_9]